MATTPVNLTINITADPNASTPSSGGGGTTPGSMPSTPITSNRREAEFKHPNRQKRNWAGWGSFVTYTQYDNDSEGEVD